MTIRVLLADDEHLVRGAMAALLDMEPDLAVVAQAADGPTAVTLTLEHRPDVAVLDLAMPGLDGLAAATRILGARPAPPTRVVLVTRHARPGVLRRALAAGVRGFVPKTTPATRLAAILREVHAGERYIDSEIAASALTEGACPLTDRERDVLRQTQDGGTVAEIANATHLAAGTVRNYLSSAITKLGVRTRHDAARLARDEGWI